MIIIIPAYRPDEKFLGLLQELRREFSDEARLVAVDDGGGAAYRSFFERAKSDYGCIVLTHPENRGKGAALKTAFRYVSEHFGENEILITADADGQHLPKDIRACLEEAERHPKSLVLGGRSFRGDVPARSRVGNALSRWSFRLLMGQRVYDTQTGLRACSAARIPFLLSVPGDRYEYEMQELCDAVKQEIPIETVYLEENKSSHFHPLADARRVYGILLKNARTKGFQILSFLFSSIFSWGIDVAVASLIHWFLYNHFPSLSDNQLDWFSMIPARVISSTVNFIINRNTVFHSRESKAKTAFLFLATVVVVLGATKGISALLQSYVFLPLLPASPNLCFTLSYVLAQIVCFPVSFLLQKFVVFPEKKDGKE